MIHHQLLCYLVTPSRGHSYTPPSLYGRTIFPSLLSLESTSIPSPHFHSFFSLPVASHVFLFFFFVFSFPSPLSLPLTTLLFLSSLPLSDTEKLSLSHAVLLLVAIPHSLVLFPSFSFFRLEEYFLCPSDSSLNGDFRCSLGSCSLSLVGFFFGLCCQIGCPTKWPMSFVGGGAKQIRAASSRSLFFCFSGHKNVIMISLRCAPVSFFLRVCLVLFSVFFCAGLLRSRCYGANWCQQDILWRAFCAFCATFDFWVFRRYGNAAFFLQ